MEPDQQDLHLEGSYLDEHVLNSGTKRHFGVSVAESGSHRTAPGNNLWNVSSPDGLELEWEIHGDTGVSEIQFTCQPVGNVKAKLVFGRCDLI